MTQSDRAIPDADKCPKCSGSGFTWWVSDEEPGVEGKWIVCRECLGTGRKDGKGRKRQKPEGPPAG